MKTKFILSAVLCLLPFLGQAQNVLPDIEVKDLEGQACSIKTALDGSTPVILTFWSTTCKPCLQELGAMNDAYVDWSDEADFKIVAVARDDARSSSKVAPMVKGRGWTDFNYYLDENGDLARAMNVQVDPTAFVLDGEGNIVFTHIGYTPGSEEELFDQILELQD